MWVKRLLSLLLFRKRREHRCSFCNTPQSAVRQLIAGAYAFICDECVEVCEGIVAQDATTPGERPHATDEVWICLVCKRGSTKPDCVVVPNRGAVCLQCADRVRAGGSNLTS
jgi:ribosomal protein L37AE/L43A